MASSSPPRGGSTSALVVADDGVPLGFVAPDDRPLVPRPAARPPLPRPGGIATFDNLVVFRQCRCPLTRPCDCRLYKYGCGECKICKARLRSRVEHRDRFPISACEALPHKHVLDLDGFVFTYPRDTLRASGVPKRPPVMASLRQIIWYAPVARAVLAQLNAEFKLLEARHEKMSRVGLLAEDAKELVVVTYKRGLSLRFMDTDVLHKSGTMQRVQVDNAVPVIRHNLKTLRDEMTAYELAITAVMDRWRALAGFHITRVARGFVARIRFRQMVKWSLWHLAAIMIQKFWRGRHTYYQWKYEVWGAIELMWKNVAARRFQAAWRKLTTERRHNIRARAWARRLYFRIRATLAIQRAWRAAKAREEYRLELDAKRYANGGRSSAGPFGRAGSSPQRQRQPGSRSRLSDSKLDSDSSSLGGREGAGRPGTGITAAQLASLATASSASVGSLPGPAKYGSYYNKAETAPFTAPASPSLNQLLPSLFPAPETGPLVDAINATIRAVASRSASRSASRAGSRTGSGSEDDSRGGDARSRSGSPTSQFSRSDGGGGGGGGGGSVGGGKRARGGRRGSKHRDRGTPSPGASPSRASTARPGTRGSRGSRRGGGSHSRPGSPGSSYGPPGSPRAGWGQATSMLDGASASSRPGSPGSVSVPPLALGAGGTPSRLGSARSGGARPDTASSRGRKRLAGADVELAFTVDGNAVGKFNTKAYTHTFVSPLISPGSRPSISARGMRRPGREDEGGGDSAGSSRSPSRASGRGRGHSAASKHRGSGWDASASGFDLFGSSMGGMLSMDGDREAVDLGAEAALPTSRRDFINDPDAFSPRVIELTDANAEAMIEIGVPAVPAAAARSGSRPSSAAHSRPGSAAAGRGGAATGGSGRPGSAGGSGRPGSASGSGRPGSAGGRPGSASATSRGSGAVTPGAGSIAAAVRAASARTRAALSAGVSLASINSLTRSQQQPAASPRVGSASGAHGSVASLPLDPSLVFDDDADSLMGGSSIQLAPLNFGAPTSPRADRAGSPSLAAGDFAFPTRGLTSRSDSVASLGSLDSVGSTLSSGGGGGAPLSPRFSVLPPGAAALDAVLGGPTPASARASPRFSPSGSPALTDLPLESRPGSASSANRPGSAATSLSLLDYMSNTQVADVMRKATLAIAEAAVSSSRPGSSSAAARGDGAESKAGGEEGLLEELGPWDRPATADVAAQAAAAGRLSPALLGVPPLGSRSLSSAGSLGAGSLGSVESVPQSSPGLAPAPFTVPAAAGGGAAPGATPRSPSLLGAYAASLTSGNALSGRLSPALAGAAPLLPHSSTPQPYFTRATSPTASVASSMASSMAGAGAAAPAAAADLPLEAAGGSIASVQSTQSASSQRSGGSSGTAASVSRGRSGPAPAADSGSSIVAPVPVRSVSPLEPRRSGTLSPSPSRATTLRVTTHHNESKDSDSAGEMGSGSLFGSATSPGPFSSGFAFSPRSPSAASGPRGMSAVLSSLDAQRSLPVPAALVEAFVTRNPLPPPRSGSSGALGSSPPHSTSPTGERRASAGGATAGSSRASRRRRGASRGSRGPLVPGLRSPRDEEEGGLWPELSRVTERPSREVEGADETDAEATNRHPLQPPAGVGWGRRGGGEGKGRDSDEEAGSEERDDEDMPGLEEDEEEEDGEAKWRDDSDSGGGGFTVPAPARAYPRTGIPVRDAVLAATALVSPLGVDPVKANAGFLKVAGGTVSDLLEDAVSPEGRRRSSITSHVLKISSGMAEEERNRPPTPPPGDPYDTTGIKKQKGVRSKSAAVAARQAAITAKAEAKRKAQAAADEAAKRAAEPKPMTDAEIARAKAEAMRKELTALQTAIASHASHLLADEGERLMVTPELMQRGLSKDLYKLMHIIEKRATVLITTRSGRRGGLGKRSTKFQCGTRAMMAAAWREAGGPLRPPEVKLTPFQKAQAAWNRNKGGGAGGSPSKAAGVQPALGRPSVLAAAKEAPAEPVPPMLMPRAQVVRNKQAAAETTGEEAIQAVYKYESAGLAVAARCTIASLPVYRVRNPSFAAFAFQPAEEPYEPPLMLPSSHPVIKGYLAALQSDTVRGGWALGGGRARTGPSWELVNVGLPDPVSQLERRMRQERAAMQSCLSFAVPTLTAGGGLLITSIDKASGTGQVEAVGAQGAVGLMPSLSSVHSGSTSQPDHLGDGMAGGLLFSTPFSPRGIPTPGANAVTFGLASAAGGTHKNFKMFRAAKQGLLASTASAASPAATGAKPLLQLTDAAPTTKAGTTLTDRLFSESMTAGVVGASGAYPLPASMPLKTPAGLGSPMSMELKLPAGVAPSPRPIGEGGPGSSSNNNSSSSSGKPGAAAAGTGRGRIGPDPLDPTSNLARTAGIATIDTVSEAPWRCSTFADVTWLIFATFGVGPADYLHGHEIERDTRRELEHWAWLPHMTRPLDEEVSTRVSTALMDAIIDAAASFVMHLHVVRHRLVLADRPKDRGKMRVDANHGKDGPTELKDDAARVAAAAKAGAPGGVANVRAGYVPPEAKKKPPPRLKELSPDPGNESRWVKAVDRFDHYPVDPKSQISQLREPYRKTSPRRAASPRGECSGLHDQGEDGRHTCSLGDACLARATTPSRPGSRGHSVKGTFTRGSREVGTYVDFSALRTRRWEEDRAAAIYREQSRSRSRSRGRSAGRRRGRPASRDGKSGSEGYSSSSRSSRSSEGSRSSYSGRSSYTSRSRSTGYSGSGYSRAWSRPGSARPWSSASGGGGSRPSSAGYTRSRPNSGVPRRGRPFTASSLFSANYSSDEEASHVTGSGGGWRSSSLGSRGSSSRPSSAGQSRGHSRRRHRSSRGSSRAESRERPVGRIATALRTLRSAQSARLRTREGSAAAAMPPMGLEGVEPLPAAAEAAAAAAERPGTAGSTMSGASYLSRPSTQAGQRPWSQMSLTYAVGLPPRRAPSPDRPETINEKMSVFRHVRKGLEKAKQKAAHDAWKKARSGTSEEGSNSSASAGAVGSTIGGPASPPKVVSPSALPSPSSRRAGGLARAGLSSLAL